MATARTPSRERLIDGSTSPCECEWEWVRARDIESGGRYIEEGLRRDDHPAVHFVDGPAGRRAALAGTGLDVREVVNVVRDNVGDAAHAAAYLELPLHLVEAAVRYYAAYREEIDRLIDLNEAEANEAQAAWDAGRQAFDHQG